MSEEALQIAEKRREVKGKGEKERYTHLNAEFQRIARRDIKRTFHAKMGSIKDRNGTDLTEVKAIKKRWQEYNRRTVQKRSSRPR